MEEALYHYLQESNVWQETTYKVTVLDASGQQLHEFPSDCSGRFRTTVARVPK